MPTHASYFTGLPVLEHGVHYLPGSGVLSHEQSARGLNEDFETLAETYRAEGYQTVGVSGNPVVGPHTGLAQGFDELLTGLFGTYEDDKVILALDELLERQDPDRPLFLFLNLSEAHQQWEGVPNDHAWLPPTGDPGPFADTAERYWRGDDAEQASVSERGHPALHMGRGSGRSCAWRLHGAIAGAWMVGGATPGWSSPPITAKCSVSMAG